MYNNIPNELKQNALFCLWKYEERGGKKTKVPYKINGARARANSATDFSSFDSVSELVDKYSGIGMGVFNGYSAIDIDHCVTDGVPNEMATDIINTMKSYTELSPSGTGVRIIFKVDDFNFDKNTYYIHNAKNGLEIYVSGATSKFVTLTGNQINDYGIANCDTALAEVLNTFMKRDSAVKTNAETNYVSYLTDESVLNKAMTSVNGFKFADLWEGRVPDGKSHSEADMSLASYLAFWCSGDVEQMDRLFRMSGLMRDKWDRAQSGSTYGEITLNRAVANASAFYKPINITCERTIDLTELHPENNDRYRWTDSGNGRLFADVFKDKARYVPERKKWFYFDGNHWCEDVESLKTMELCKELANALLKHAITITDEHKRTEFLKHCNKWQVRRNRETILKDARSIYPLNMREFDNNSYLFNCANGTLNLETMEFCEHNASDFLTKISPVIYDPVATNERFDSFITEVMSTDTEKALFLQKALGYALTGDTKYECMFFLYGATTRNGKGTLMESILGVMGDYGKSVRPETIAAKQNNSSQNPTEDIARLSGLRFANISEPSRGITLNAAQVKSMTGNDTINARYLHENSFDFKPQFKLYVNTNYLPVITDMTLFSSNRIFIIPFDRHFEPWEQDNSLKTEFAKTEVQSAILNWLVQGYVALCKEGLNPPSAVTNATTQYCRDSDKVQQFFDDCLIEQYDGEVRTSSVYNAYRNWCGENGYYPESTRGFYQSLRTKATVKRKRPLSGGEKASLLIGYKLKDTFLCL
ncbi:MAG: nucleoside triphosphatase [Clostridia bacterium]|nr:nucleoside triphosphatase [Clostridia bacterium]